MERGYEMKARLGVVMAIVAMVLVSSVAYGGYSDVVTAIAAESPSVMPERIRFSWITSFHQDRFLAGAGIEPAVSPGAGGYVIVEGPTVTTPVMGYGMGNIVDVKLTVGGTTYSVPIDSTIKGAFGNLCVASEKLIPFSFTGPGLDTATDLGATGVGVDVLTGAVVPGLPAVKYTDANGDGIIRFVTSYKFGAAGDYNRDGVIDSGALTSAGVGGASDLPFVVMYETTAASPIDLTNPPTFDADGDGILTDNMWLGNPYTPVDAADPVVTAIADADPNISAMVGFVDPLLIGEIVGMQLVNEVHLNLSSQSQSFITSTGTLDVEITDGRLLDYARGLPAYSDDLEYLAALLNASAFFTPGGDIFSEYEWTDDGTVDIIAPPIAEPGSLSLLLGGAAMALRRRRRK
jgi:hypothetical protein